MLRRSNSRPGLPPDVTAQLFAAATERSLKPGEALFLAGDQGDGCYRLERGLIKITVRSLRGEERIIALLGRGEIIGELALIDHQPRSASAVAIRDSNVRHISRQSFEAFTQEHPKIYRHLVGLLAARLRATDEELAASSFLSVR